jgi:prevent-host-death family protein
MESQKVGIEQARGQLGDLVSAAANDGQVTIITKNGIPAAALVPLSLLPKD